MVMFSPSSCCLASYQRASCCLAQQAALSGGTKWICRCKWACSQDLNARFEYQRFETTAQNWCSTTSKNVALAETLLGARYVMLLNFCVLFIAPMPSQNLREHVTGSTQEWQSCAPQYWSAAFPKSSGMAKRPVSYVCLAI